MPAPKTVKEKAAMAETLIARASTANTPPGDPEPAQPTLSVVTDIPTPGNPYAFDPSKAPTPPVEPSPQNWEHKYNVLQGMFSKQQSTNADRISQLENQISTLTTLVDRPAPLTSQETFHPPESAKDYGLTEEQVEELGGMEFIESVRKISAAGAAGEITSLRNELNNLKNSQSESREESFYNQLDRLCPEWREMNKSDQFETWLLTEEGISGIPKQNFLTNAYDNLDAEIAARYFNEFKAKFQRPPGDNPDVLSDLVPPPGGHGQTPNAQGGVMYTPKSIAQFFKDKGLGKFKGREDEAAAIEADIFAAQREGRVLPKTAQ